MTNRGFVAPTINRARGVGKLGNFSVKILIVACAAFAVSACAAGAPRKLQTTDSRECAQNLTYTGSLLSNQMFKTHQFVEGTSKSVALERAAKVIVANGMAIVSIDKEMGILSASQSVVFDKGGGTVPLTVTVDSAKSGVDVALTFSIGVGQVAGEDSVRDLFCQVIEAIDIKS